MYDFDRVIDRSGTDSVKWGAKPACAPAAYPDAIPLWVADMDFSSPPAVVAAVRKRAEHPIYGYALKPAAFYDAYVGWMRDRYGVRVDAGWLSFSPGIVPAIGTAIRAFSSPGDGVAIMPPVYHPFKTLIDKNRRLCVEAPLAVKDGRYGIDLAALDAACARSKLLVLCSPHNPVGRVWDADELRAVAEIAKRRDVVVMSDEIHADLVYAPGRLVPSLGLDERLQERLVSAWAPSKTFNIAGFQASYIVSPNEALRAAFDRENEAAGIGTPNCMAVSAAAAAYAEGGPWLDEALAYMRGNYELLSSELAKRAPSLEVYPCEGTFLAWIDFRGAGLVGDVGPRVIERAGVWLDSGARFGTGGDGFARLNFGCPRSVLAEAVDRLAKAFG